VLQLYVEAPLALTLVDSNLQMEELVAIAVTVGVGYTFTMTVPLDLQFSEFEKLFAVTV
jgi:hypothetical protein